ncbi:MAG TPA: hypothetical protein VFA27_13705 [Vicinamibacterales bacterium]|nr:hypothetical protein [Vicinamibacterales bacterium]
MPFHHADHLQLAIECLRESPSFDAAVDRMAAALRAKAAAAGAPEKYHHTVTVFWMRLVEWMLDKDLPSQFYSDAVLRSDAARRGWVEPDLARLPGRTPRPTTVDRASEAPPPR